MNIVCFSLVGGQVTAVPANSEISLISDKVDHAEVV